MARLPPETVEPALSARGTIRRGWQRYRVRRILLQNVDLNGAVICIHVPKTAGMSIAEVTLVELEKAPVPVREHLGWMPESLIEVLSLDAEAPQTASSTDRESAR